jgi:hypothetical protein
VLTVTQPTSNQETLQRFNNKEIELASAGMIRFDFVNPAGHRWVLLPVPGTSQDE